MQTNAHFKLLYSFIFLFGICTNALAQTYTKNKYNLEIIDNVNAYKKEIQLHKNTGLVLLSGYIPNFKTNFVYATDKNFTHTILYKNPKPYALLPLANALKNVAKDLAKKGFGILLFDAYRPYSVTEKMWQIVPDARYAADPKFGSGHNRGIAVDITLYKLSDGKTLQMPTGFDNFTDTAHSDYMNLSKEILANRKLLKDEMNKYGFTQLPTEWWHFSIANPDDKYKIINLTFDELNKLVKSN